MTVNNIEHLHKAVAAYLFQTLQENESTLRTYVEKVFSYTQFSPIDQFLEPTVIISSISLNETKPYCISSIEATVNFRVKPVKYNGMPEGLQTRRVNLEINSESGNFEGLRFYQ